MLDICTELDTTNYTCWTRAIRLVRPCWRKSWSYPFWTFVSMILWNYMGRFNYKSALFISHCDAFILVGMVVGDSRWTWSRYHSLKRRITPLRWLLKQGKAVIFVTSISIFEFVIWNTSTQTSFRHHCDQSFFDRPLCGASWKNKTQQKRVVNHQTPTLRLS